MNEDDFDKDLLDLVDKGILFMSFNKDLNDWTFGLTELGLKIAEEMKSARNEE